MVVVEVLVLVVVVVVIIVVAVVVIKMAAALVVVVIVVVEVVVLVVLRLKARITFITPFNQTILTFKWESLTSILPVSPGLASCPCATCIWYKYKVVVMLCSSCYNSIR
ncbi:hypothetical protein ElyMa_004825100 [Elysia marginata]|uniref:Uncharacterized protein n=1 Tax=Elysia marginata TaxID=1093978 RepID=A0AAV4ILQ3_9GAST|nr:hypothetical protein ElyMa_004825100 [Elysia marginata]